MPPGDILAETMAEHGISAAELARLTGLPVETVRGVVSGVAVVTAEVAARLERVLGVSAGMWMALERLYRGERSGRVYGDSR